MLSHSQRRSDGHDAESIAARFLEEKGFRFVARNYTTRSGEIDLIMEDGPAIVFIEVKRRRNSAYGEPEESITPGKCRRIVHSALLYAQRYRLVDRLMRFDVVIIEPTGARHLPNAFGSDMWSTL